MAHPKRIKRARNAAKQARNEKPAPTQRGRAWGNLALGSAVVVALAAACGLALHRDPAAQTPGVSKPAVPAPIAAATPLPQGQSLLPPSGTNGKITLDPVCDMVVTQTPKLAPGHPAPATRRMSERLARIYAQPSAGLTGYMSDRLAEHLQNELTNATGLNEKLRLQFHLAVEQINAARPDSALNTFASMDRMIAQTGGR